MSVPKQATALLITCYLTIYIVWGSTYFFIKMAVESIPPFYVIGLRWFIGGIFFITYASLTGRISRFPTTRQILASVFLGFFLLIGGNGLITVAERHVDSYLVALIMASTPIVVAFFDWVLLRKKIAGTALIGIVIGIVGVAFLLYNGKSIATNLTPEIGLVLGGLLCWGFATSLGHRLKVYPDVFVNSGIQMLLIGIICLGGMVCGKPGLVQTLASFSVRSNIGLWYLAIVGSLAFGAYNYLIIHEPAIRLVSYAFVNPAIAVILGLLIGHESPARFLAVGLPFVLIGLFLMLYGDTFLNYMQRQIKAFSAEK